MDKLLRFQVEEMATSVIGYYTFGLEKIAREQMRDDFKYILRNDDEAKDYYKKIIRSHRKNHMN